MKVKHVLMPAALAVFLAAAWPTLAAEGKAADAEIEKTETKKKVKPHSHMEEKTGMPAMAREEGKAEPKDAEAMKQRHSHPRDAK